VRVSQIAGGTADRYGLYTLIYVIVFYYIIVMRVLVDAAVSEQCETRRSAICQVLQL